MKKNVMNMDSFAVVGGLTSCVDMFKPNCAHKFHVLILPNLLQYSI